MTPVEVDGHQIAEWRDTNYPYKVIAAQIAEWATGQARGTVLPGNEFFAGDVAIVASAACAWWSIRPSTWGMRPSQNSHLTVEPIQVSQNHPQ